MKENFNEWRSGYDRYEPPRERGKSPREWDKPPIWVTICSILLIGGSMVLGIALMNDMDDLAETYKLERTALPLGKLFLGYMTLPFAAVCAVVNIGYFYCNLKGTIIRLFKSLSKSTYKFGK